MTIIHASRITIERYKAILFNTFATTKNKKKLKTILHLQAMCETILKNTPENDNDESNMTEDKVSRWLGYIQGVMTVHKWINVPEERDLTRPLFHQAYEDMGIDKPTKLDTIPLFYKFHITSMEEFNNTAIKKYNVKSYKELSNKKLLKVCFKIMKKSKPTVYKILKKLNYTFEFHTRTDKTKDKYTFYFTNLSIK